MKATLDLQDELLVRAKALSKRTGRPLRALVEEGLRLVLAKQRQTSRYHLPDCSVGEAGAPDPLEALSWQDFRGACSGRCP